MALADIIGIGVSPTVRYRSADRAKIDDYTTQTDAYNTAVDQYNTQLESFKSAYDPWLAKAQAFNTAVEEWNAGPRTSDYAGPENPGEWTGGEPPSAPAALPFTEDDITAFQEQAKGRAIRSANTLGTAYSLFGGPNSNVRFGAPQSGTDIEFSFSGSGFAEGGLVPGLPFNRSIRSSSEDTMTRYAPGYLAELQATGQPLPPDPMLSSTPSSFGGVKGPFTIPKGGSIADPKDFFTPTTGTMGSPGGIGAYRSYLMDTYSPIAENATEERVNQFMDMVGRAEKAHFGVQDQGINFSDGGAVDQGIGSLPEAYYGFGGFIKKIAKSLPFFKSSSPAPAPAPTPTPGPVPIETPSIMPIVDGPVTQPIKKRGFFGGLGAALRAARLRKQQAAEQADGAVAPLAGPVLQPMVPAVQPAIQSAQPVAGPVIQALSQGEDEGIGNLFASLIKKTSGPFR